MTQLEYTIEIERPLEEVFDVVADPRNDHLWCPRVGDCRQLVGNAPHVGARYELQHNPSLQRPHERRIQIIELQRPYKVLSVQEDNVARFTISYLLEPMQTGTKLTQRDEIDWNIGPLSRRVGTRIVNRHIGEQLHSLKRLLESRDDAYPSRRTSTEGGSTDAHV